ncbi:AAA family ATPase [Mycobacterium sp. pUA109]|uniref:AAA family ATPase n=1 Tax=Mycobacterium sp. pUA109 TaxID=3238982 RepID=UPI00351B9E1E
MKLHRLVLTNYRGVAHREIDFPDHGVVVVSGANEVGKSSMIEALDLLLESKDRSTKKDVKQVKPTHADVGAEVTAEISTGPYRFVYHKRFHKKAETQLTVLAPRREQLTGDEAHERVRAILTETMDTDLWRAQRVLQAASTAAVDLSGCDALSRALDVAAGDTATSSGTEPLLIERIDAEYGRYFTATGRPTGEWATAIAALGAAEDEVARCAADLAEVDDRVRRHAELTEQLAQLAGQQEAAGARHTAARAAADRIAELTEQLREAQLIATAAEATSTASTAAHTERVRLRTDLDTRTTAITALAAEARDAADAESTARQAAEAADAAVEQSAEVLAAAERRVEAARRVVDQLAHRDEADRLAARLAKIDATQRDHDLVCGELSGITVTEALLRRIEDATAALDRAAASLAAISATVEVTAAADLELVVGDQRVSLPAGQSWSTTATAATEVAVPDLLTVRVRPGDTARDAEAKCAAAQQELGAALQAAGVADLAAARSADQRRRELHGRRDQLGATLAALRGDDPLDQLRGRLEQLRADQPDVATDAAAARAELDAAAAARAQAAADTATRRREAAAAAGQLTENTTRAALRRDKVAAQRTELDAVAERLAAQRASVSDDDLAGTADANAQAVHTAQQRVADLSDQLAAASPDAVAAELAAAAADAGALRTRHAETARALHAVEVELAVFGTEGRKGKLDAAENSRAHAAAEHARIGRRARAAQLLRSTMARHRDTTRQRYVAPFRAEIERLGRPVFGPSFEVDVDSDLRINTRTLDGRTVPYESLSGGAKEQLGILARLAGAALVAKEDTVPVLIDDALGFTDPGRLASMGEVFDMVGADGQVIVLTCTPARYQSVDGAHRIELSA